MNGTPCEASVKTAVRSRDGNACTECGMTNEESLKAFGRGLHVHRLVPKSRYTVDGCVLLCKLCHAVVHGATKVTVPDKVYPPTLGPTTPRQFRLDDDTMRKLDELAAVFGGEVRPIPRAAVLRHAIHALHRKTKGKNSE